MGRKKERIEELESQLRQANNQNQQLQQQLLQVNNQRQQLPQQNQQLQQQLLQANNQRQQLQQQNQQLQQQLLQANNQRQQLQQQNQQLQQQSFQVNNQNQQLQQQLKREQEKTKQLHQHSQEEIENLVFQGGGVKGTAYLGALDYIINQKKYITLSETSKIKRVAGASAGAITALLIALGLTYEEIRKKIDEKDFKTFLDDTEKDKISGLSVKDTILKLIATLENGCNIFFGHNVSLLYVPPTPNGDLDITDKNFKNFLKARKTNHLPIIIKNGTNISIYGKNAEGNLGITKLDENKFIDIKFPPFPHKNENDEDDEDGNIKRQVVFYGRDSGDYVECFLDDKDIPQKVRDEITLKGAHVLEDNFTKILVYYIYRIFKEHSFDCVNWLLGKKESAEELKDRLQTEAENKDLLDPVSYLCGHLASYSGKAAFFTGANQLLKTINWDVDSWLRWTAEQVVSFGTKGIKDIEAALKRPGFFENDIDLENFIKSLDNVFSALKERDKDKNGNDITDTGRIGLFSGKKFLQWIKDEIKERTGNEDITFEEFNNRKKNNPGKGFKDLYVVSLNLSLGITQIFSHELTPKVLIADAVRASMSIPLFFKPPVIHKYNSTTLYNNHLYTDGGVNDNYPIWIFDYGKFVNGDKGDYVITNPKTLGLRLVTAEQKKFHEQFNENDPLFGVNIGDGNNNKYDVNLKDYITSLGGGFLNSQESEHFHRKDRDRTIYIDTCGVSLFDFNLDKDKKKKLIESGNQGASDYFDRLKESKNHTSNNINTVIAPPKITDQPNTTHLSSFQSDKTQIKGNSMFENRNSNYCFSQNNTKLLEIKWQSPKPKPLKPLKPQNSSPDSPGSSYSFWKPAIIGGVVGALVGAIVKDAAIALFKRTFQSATNNRKYGVEDQSKNKRPN